MALSSKIPPQAYTRDTLVKAIEWLSVQPPSVRERATSADLIVSHYLQSRRKGDTAQLDLPVAAEEFKSDLRQLAAELNHPEELPPPGPTRSPSYIIPPPSLSHAPVEERAFERADFAAPVRESHFRPRREAPVRRPEPAAPAPAPTPSHAGPTWAIDKRSLEIARELQDRLNLSCESEAIRLLITMGAERARGLFF